MSYFSSLYLIVFENHGYDEVAGLASHKCLAATGAVFTNYYAITHPSGPNYRSLVAGDFFSTDEFIDVEHPTLASELDKIHVHTSVVYFAGVPAKRHDPYLDLHTPVNVLDRAHFNGYMIGTGPGEIITEHVYLGLDDSNNAHSASLDIADANLTDLLDMLDRSPRFVTPDANGKYPALFVVWDEVYNADNRVFAAFYGKSVKPGLYSTYRNHYSFLATACENYGLPFLAHSAGLQTMSEVFQ